MALDWSPPVIILLVLLFVLTITVLTLTIWCLCCRELVREGIESVSVPGAARDDSGPGVASPPAPGCAVVPQVQQHAPAAIPRVPRERMLKPPSTGSRSRSPHVSDADSPAACVNIVDCPQQCLPPSFSSRAIDAQSLFHREDQEHAAVEQPIVCKLGSLTTPGPSTIGVEQPLALAKPSRAEDLGSVQANRSASPRTPRGTLIHHCAAALVAAVLEHTVTTHDVGQCERVAEDARYFPKSASPRDADTNAVDSTTPTSPTNRRAPRHCPFCDEPYGRSAICPVERRPHKLLKDDRKREKRAKKVIQQQLRAASLSPVLPDAVHAS